MEEKNIQVELQELGIPDEKIEEILYIINNARESKGDRSNGDFIADLKDKIRSEMDWKKRAQLCARLISYNLDS